MNAQTLAQIKKEIRKFHAVIEPIAQYWSDYRNVTLSVLVQNMGHDASICWGYDHEDTVKKLYTLLNIIRGIANYSETDHFSNWVYQEIDSIVQGNVTMENYEAQEDNYSYVAQKLYELNHTPAFVSHEIEYMKNNPHETAQLHDDTCAIITSQEYCDLFGSWQFGND